MGAVETVLSTEYSRIQRVIARLEDECDQRPRGSLVVKIRGSGRYIYLVSREQGSVVTRYIGKEGSWKVKGIEAKIEERRRYVTELAEARAQKSRLEKMIRAGECFFLEPGR